ncbi:GIY-YIG nuclease family protein [Flavobacterium okayamense]|nr:GIY-YIG nuclease family protein [Flavobacterium okayamense]
MFYTYILFSTKTHKYYVGQTNNLSDRLFRHNSGQQVSTKNGIPWILIVSFDFSTRKEAVYLETKIKKRGIKRFLIDNDLLEQ